MALDSTWREYAGYHGLDEEDVGEIILTGSLGYFDGDYGLSFYTAIGIQSGDDMSTVKKTLGHALDVVRQDVQNEPLMAAILLSRDVVPGETLTDEQRVEMEETLTKTLVWLCVS